MSSPSSSPTSSSGTPIPPSTPGIGRKILNGTKWTYQTSYSLGSWVLSRPTSWLITDPLNRVIDHSQHKIEQLTQPDGPFATQLQQTLEQALLQQPSQEMLQLQDLIKKVLNAPNDITIDEIKQIYEHMQLLSKNDWALLKRLSPKLNDENIQFFDVVMKFFQTYAESTDIPAEVLRAFNEKVLEQDFKNGLQKFHAFFSEILIKSQGALIKAMDYLKQALVSEQQGVLSEALELLRTKCTNEKDGIITQAMDLLSRKLGDVQKKLLDDDGILDKALKMLENRLTDKDAGLLVQARNYLSKELTDEKEGILAKAVELLNLKLKEKGGPLDTLEVRLTHEDTGILSKAVGVLQTKLMAKDGVVDQLDERLTGQAHPLLTAARKKLKELQKSIIDQNKREINKFSQEALTLLEQISSNPGLVFTKQPLSAGDLLLINQLKSQLPSFCADTLPSQGEMLINVEAGLSAINRYYNSYEGIAARTAAILEEKLADAVNPVLKRIEEAPRRMIENVLNMAQSQESTAAPEDGNVAQFLSYGASILKKVIDQGGKVVSQHALSSFSYLMVQGLRQALGQMETTEAFKMPRGVLIQIIRHLEHPQPVLENLTPQELAEARSNDPDAFDKNGPLSPIHTLYNRMQRAAETLNSLKIYVNGFRVPHFGKTGSMETSAEAAFMDNTTLLREAIKPATAPEPQNLNWKRLAEEERDKLIDNTTQYLSLKYIYEDVCHLKPESDQFYLELLKKSKTRGPDSTELSAQEAQEKLKKSFFEKLSEKNVNFVLRLWAKFYYNVVYGFIVKRYVSKASTIYFNEIFQYIEKHAEKNFDALRNQLTKNFTRYLVILGGAYQAVASSRENGLPEEMLKKELEKPEANLMFETKELYLAFAQDMIKKSLGSGLMARIAKKLIGDPEIIVRNIVDKATGALQDTSGYTHALNSVISEQLGEIWKELQKQQLRRQSDPSIDSESNLSEIRKDELTALVKNLFEILSKSKCHTLDELRSVLKKELLSENINRAIDDLFIEDVIEKVTNILAVTIQSLVKKDQLQKLTYKFASLLNQSFELGAPITPAVMKEQERQISNLCVKILHTSVETAVEEKFDFAGKKQQGECNTYVRKLHELSSEFFQSCKDDLSALEAPDMDFSSPAGKNKIDKIFDQTESYEKQCSDSAASFETKRSKMNSDNKDEISERYLGIARESKPFVQAVVQMKQHLLTLENLQVAVPKLKEIQKIIHYIPVKLFYPESVTNQEFSFCENQLLLLEGHLKGLRKLNHITGYVEQISKEIPVLSATIVELRKAHQTREFFTALRQPNSLLAQIVNERKQSLPDGAISPELNAKLAHLRQAMRNSFNDAYFRSLANTLNAIENATVAEQIDHAYQEFFTLANQASAQSTNTIDTEKRKYEISCRAIEKAINDSHQLDPNIEEEARRGIQTAVVHAKQHLESLETWEQEHVKEIPYINFSIFDMKGLQDFATGRVYSRVQERLDGLMKLLRKEETYRYGILNHLLLIPYVQSMRSTDVKKN